MPLKDYYAILQIPPSATVPEIKKAYRKLALLYHPDKTGNDAYAGAQFNEIKEAYETLTQPGRKDAYLQQRWYEKTINRRFDNNEPVTPPTVLKQCLELNRYIAGLNVFRLDQAGLSLFIQGLLSDDVIKQLHNFDEAEILQRIVSVVLDCCHPLNVNYLLPVATQLKKLAGADRVAANEVEQFIKKTQRKDLWHRYNVLAAIIITLLLCWLIYKTV